MNQYPDQPGYKRIGTSQEAAISISNTAQTLREMVLKTLVSSDHGMTADEIADSLDRSILSIRPRVSELAFRGLLEDSGERRRNRSGKRAVVWIPVSQQSLF